MKIVKIQWEGTVRYGVADDEAVYALDGSVLGEHGVGARLCSLDKARLLPPVEPRTIVGVGANYHSLLREVDMAVPSEPVLFLKASSSVVGHQDNVIYPRFSRDIRIEGELAVVMKRDAWRVPEDRALEYVLGYTCANDLTAHDQQERLALRTKSFNTSCPLGPCIATGIDGDNLGISSRLNGTVVQSGSTSDMVFGVGKIISYVSGFLPLRPFDVVLTGTCSKGARAHIGDRIEIEIEQIGVLQNNVIVPE